MGFGPILPALGQVDPFTDDDLQPTVADYVALFDRQDQGSIYQELEDVSKSRGNCFPRRVAAEEIPVAEQGQISCGGTLLLSNPVEEAASPSNREISATQKLL